MLTGEQFQQLRQDIFDVLDDMNDEDVADWLLNSWHGLSTAHLIGVIRDMKNGENSS